MASIGFAETFNDGQSVAVIGVKLYYADGAITRHAYDAVGGIVNWTTAPATGVQCMNVYFNRTYQLAKPTGVETARYKRTLIQQDYYWYSPLQGFGAGMAGEPPLDAANKLGSAETEAVFYAAHNTAFEDRAF